MSYILCIVPLIFPHQQHYAFLMCLPAVAMVCLWLINASQVLKQSLRYRLVLGAMILIFVVFNASLFAGALNAWLNHFKILTYGAILLCILLALSFTRRRVL